jgi:hypothetical protein
MGHDFGDGVLRIPCSSMNPSPCFCFFIRLDPAGAAAAFFMHNGFYLMVYSIRDKDLFGSS